MELGLQIFGHVGPVADQSKHVAHRTRRIEAVDLVVPQPFEGFLEV